MSGTGPVREPVKDAASLLACGFHALLVDGDLESSRDFFELAYREGARTGDGEIMARATVGLGGLWVDEHRTFIAAARLRARLEQVLAMLDPSSDLAIRVRVRLAAEADYRTGGQHNVLPLLGQTRAAANRVVHTEALRLAHHCLLGPDHGEARRALSDELVGEAARNNQGSELLIGLLLRTVDAFLDGDARATRWLVELRRELADGQNGAIEHAVQALEVMRSIRAGQLDRAEALAEDCVERGRKAGVVDAVAWHAAQLVAIRWYQGRLPELLPMIVDLVDAPEISAVDNSFVAAYAVVAARAGDKHAAAAAMARLRGRALAALPRSGGWLVVMFGLVEAAALTGNVHPAARAYQLLTPYADLPIMGGFATTCFGSVHHALGVAALTTGDNDVAVAHLREAVYRNLAIGHWPAVLHSRQRLAEALVRRNNPQDEAAAHEQCQLATEAATRLRAQLEPDNRPPGPPDGSVVLVRHGRRWHVDLGRHTALVDHSVGMLHLAVLTANPGVEVSALELVAGVEALGRAALGQGALGQSVLDRMAIQRYRRRLAQLNDDAGGGLEHERDWLLSELSANVRPDGRFRTFADDAERSRVAVGRAIRRTIDHIERVEPLIAAHLRATVHTGIRCWYRPI